MFLNMIRISWVWVSVTTVFLTTGELTTVKAGKRPPSPPSPPVIIMEPFLISEY
jgi:hypothetical protein